MVPAHGVSLFLSYFSRADAMNFRNKDASAYIYPICKHVNYDSTMYKNGRGGFEYSTAVKDDFTSHHDE